MCSRNLNHICGMPCLSPTTTWSFFPSILFATLLLTYCLAQADCLILVATHTVQHFLKKNALEYGVMPNSPIHTKCLGRGMPLSLHSRFHPTQSTDNVRPPTYPKRHEECDTIWKNWNGRKNQSSSNNDACGSHNNTKNYDKGGIGSVQGEGDEEPVNIANPDFVYRNLYPQSSYQHITENYGRHAGIKVPPYYTTPNILEINMINLSTPSAGSIRRFSGARCLHHFLGTQVGLDRICSYRHDDSNEKKLYRDYLGGSPI